MNCEEMVPKPAEGNLGRLSVRSDLPPSQTSPNYRRSVGIYVGLHNFVVEYRLGSSSGDRSFGANSTVECGTSPSTMVSGCLMQPPKSWQWW